MYEGGKTVEIPVRYDGPDLQDVAVAADLSPEDVIRLHSSETYRVYFLGFTGGFPYLGGLPAALASVPRLDASRKRVPKGSVGVAGGQTGVYTLDSPGGWRILGTTDETLFDATRNPPARLSPGDAVRFVPKKLSSSDVPISSSVPSSPPSSSRCFEVVRAGPMTTIQDLGRFGVSRLGVSRSGACDEMALRAGNVLLGNDANAAALEVAMGGLTLRSVTSSPCAVALTGADCGATLRRSTSSVVESVAVNEVVRMERGDLLELGFATEGARTYVCIDGDGVDIDEVMGSRSTDLRAHIGRSVLKEGDALGRRRVDGTATTRDVRSAYDPLRHDFYVDDPNDENEDVVQLALLRGPGDPASTFNDNDDHEESNYTALVREEARFHVSPRNDRMACVLSSDSSSAKHIRGGQQLSEPCVPGTVQIPPSGEPTILNAECQTSGGYAVAGVVAQADMWKVGQLRTGQRVRFVRESVENAKARLIEMRRRVIQTEANLSLTDSMVRGPNQISSLSVSPSPSPSGSSSSRQEVSSSLRKIIDLNADVGEGAPHDNELFRYVTSANVSCGAHAGSPVSIARTIAKAVDSGVTIGAHPAFEDPEHFGRVHIEISEIALRDQVLYQVGALRGLCEAVDATVEYVKPHGALYHAVMRDPKGSYARAVVDACQMLDLPLLLMPRSPHATFGEAFAERAYDGDELRPRDRPGAVIHDPRAAADQAVRIVENDERVRSVCVHGDSPNAARVAAAVRVGLERHGYSLRSFV